MGCLTPGTWCLIKACYDSRNMNHIVDMFLLYDIFSLYDMFLVYDGPVQLVRSVAAKGGHDLGKDLTESFFQQWVTGQCVPYLRVGYHHKKKANVINLVVEQVAYQERFSLRYHSELGLESQNLIGNGR